MWIFPLQLQSTNGFAPIAGKPGSEPTQQQSCPTRGTMFYLQSSNSSCSPPASPRPLT